MAISGRVIILLLLGVIPVAISPLPSVLLAWVGGVVVLVILDLLLAASPRKLQVSRLLPTSVRLTVPATSELELTNLAGRTMHLHLRDAWPPSAVAPKNRHSLSLPNEETRKVRTTMLPRRRGDLFAGPVTVRSFGPLGLAARQLSLPVPGQIRVLPEFAARKHLPSRMARLRELDGTASVQLRGPGTEFDSLREYVAGDDVRSIDWRATARRQEVVVRTWRPERDRHVMILVDVSRTSAARVADAPKVEAAIEASLLLAALANHAGDRVDVLAYDRKVRAQCYGLSGARLLPSLAQELSSLHPMLIEMDWPGAVATLQQRLGQRALVVLLTSLDTAAVESGLLRVVGQLSKDHTVVLASIDDPDIAVMSGQRDSIEDVYEAAAAERQTLSQQATAVQLRQRGVEVLTAEPDHLAPALADKYLDLKAAGRL